MPQRLRAEDLWSGQGRQALGGSPIAALWGSWAHSPGLSVAAGSERERASLQMGSWARPNHQPGIELSGMLLAAPGNGRPQLPRNPSSVCQCLSSGWCSRRRLGRPVAHSLAKWPLPRPRPQGRSPSTCLLWSLLFDMLQLAAPLQSDYSPLKVLVVRFACCTDASLVQVVCVDEAKETDGRVEYGRSVEISVPLLMASGVCLGPLEARLPGPSDVWRPRKSWLPGCYSGASPRGFTIVHSYCFVSSEPAIPNPGAGANSRCGSSRGSACQLPPAMQAVA